MKKLLALAAVLLLSACGTTSTSMIPPEDLYPKALTTCAEEPATPPRRALNEPRTDADHATYIKNLRGAFYDCKDTVGGWKDRRERYVTQYEHQRYSYVERLWRTVTDATDGE